MQAVSYTADQLEQYWRGLHHAVESDDEEEEDEEDDEQQADEAAPPPQMVESAANRPPVAAAIASNAELHQQIKQLQLQLQLQQSSQMAAAAAAAAMPPTAAAAQKRKKPTPISIGSKVSLSDGRTGIFKSSGNGYMQVELLTSGAGRGNSKGGGQAGQVVHVRSADVSPFGESTAANDNASNAAASAAAAATAAAAAAAAAASETSMKSASAYVNVKLHDGRAGKMLSSGHGYVRVALTNGKVSVTDR